RRWARQHRARQGPAHGGLGDDGRGCPPRPDRRLEPRGHRRRPPAHRGGDPPPPAPPPGWGGAAHRCRRTRRGGAGMTPVLEARAVSVRFGGVVANDSVDVTIGSGELVGVIGPNGAGKTTFIDAITGFVPSTGHVHLAGDDLSSLPAAA